jgi:hypothetical protein
MSAGGPAAVADGAEDALADGPADAEAAAELVPGVSCAV